MTYHGYDPCDAADKAEAKMKALKSAKKVESQQGLLMKYFVLKPDGKSPYHYASRRALLAYAQAIAVENPTLAKDLKKWHEDLAFKANDIV